MNSTENLDKLYQERFPDADLPAKNAIWKVLCADFFQRYVDSNDVVADIGAGYCEFINNIDCARKIAVDINPDVHRFAAPGVEIINAPCTAISQLEAGSVDVVFMSNFLEHLPGKAQVLETLRESHRILRAGGRVIILQPNIRFLPGEYWDFFDHHTPLTDRSLVEGVKLAGFTPVLVIPRFLPYTTRSRLPQSPFLVRLYLRFPPIWRVLGKQAVVIARKPGS